MLCSFSKFLWIVLELFQLLVLKLVKFRKRFEIDRSNLLFGVLLILFHLQLGFWILVVANFWINRSTHMSRGVSINIVHKNIVFDKSRKPTIFTFIYSLDVGSLNYLFPRLKSSFQSLRIYGSLVLQKKIKKIEQITYLIFLYLLG